MLHCDSSYFIHTTHKSIVIHIYVLCTRTHSITSNTNTSLPLQRHNILSSSYTTDYREYVIHKCLISVCCFIFSVSCTECAMIPSHGMNERKKKM